MKWFDTYVSNSLGDGGNQNWFEAKADEWQYGRIYYKIFAGGSYGYSFLFSNIMDSTYDDGSRSYCNRICEEWEMKDVRVGLCEKSDVNKAEEPEVWYPITFQGHGSKRVMPGEVFTSDPVNLSAEKDVYLCLEMGFRGSEIPHHELSLLPAFVQDGEEWMPSSRVPFPGMIGCDRKVKTRVGYFGDSITNGFGTPMNEYRNWCALVSEAIGTEYSFWNLGIGYGRAQDAASDSAWLWKAKQADLVTVGFGTNDILQGRRKEQIYEDLYVTVKKLQEAGCKVLLLSLPPFDYEGELLENWLWLNRRIRAELTKEADGFFDMVPVLINGAEADGRTKYGDHPNSEGCRRIAEAILPIVKQNIVPKL